MTLNDGRRQLLKHAGSAMATLTLPLTRVAEAAKTGTIAVKAVTTDLTSSNERMISYRHQQHLVQSSDGTLHLLVNRGTLTPGPELSLFSSFDGGSTWRFMLSFANTDDKSTGDLLLQGDDLSMVYHTVDDKVMFARLHYDNLLQTWTLTTLEQAFSSARWLAMNPALAIDALGTVWVGFLAKTPAKLNSVGTIRVVNRVGGGNVWTDPNLSFGPTDNQAVERSARPVAIPGGMGMVWSVHEVTYWSMRSNSLPDNSAWTQATIYTGIPTSQVDDPYASHFNVTTDDQGGVHMISIENYDVLYFRYSAAGDSWSAPRVIDDSRKVAYAQMGMINGKLGIGYSVQRGSGTLAVSTDLGDTWFNYADLNLLAIYPGVNYNTARIELPTRSTGVMPILQQYADTVGQKLMLFKVPAP
jgi:hypothetical protein